MCAGYGGIGLGIKNIFGERLRTIAYCELEGFAQANLISKMEKGLLDAAPIWSDLKTFPYESFHGLVDILIAGYPCQPFSAAGKRAGKEDPRHLWPWIADGIRLLQPRMCFFENVEGHISLGLSTVISDLEELGYAVSWGIFSASEVGAPHQRKRVFILAYDQSQRIQGHGADWLQELRPHVGQGLLMRGGDAGCGELADALCNGSGESWLIRQRTDGSESVRDGKSWGANQLANAGRIEPQGWGSATQGQQSGTGRIPRSQPAPCHDQVWPSRPGQPQYAYEPPRVVANSNSSRRQTQRNEPFTQWRENTISQSSELGNAKCVLLPAAGEHGAMDEASRIPADGEGSEPTQADSDASLARSGEAMANPVIVGRRGRRDGNAGGMCGEIQTAGSCGGGTEVLGNAESGWRGESRDEISARQGHCTARPSRSDEQHSQAQPALGGDADGTARGLGYAELCVSCDNRTDELRLLGNGVVPATAERAFLTLLEKLK